MAIFDRERERRLSRLGSNFPKPLGIAVIRHVGLSWFELFELV